MHLVAPKWFSPWHQTQEPTPFYMLYISANYVSNLLEIYLMF